MTAKVIVSSGYLLTVLQRIHPLPEQEIRLELNSRAHYFKIDDNTLSCECNGDIETMVTAEVINRLINLLKVLKDQPITLMLNNTSNYISIKDALI